MPKLDITSSCIVLLAVTLLTIRGKATTLSSDNISRNNKYNMMLKQNEVYTDFRPTKSQTLSPSHIFENTAKDGEREYGKLLEKPNLSDVILRRTVKNADEFQSMVAENTLTALAGSAIGQARMCRIEVQEIRKVPGHCIKLLGGMNACEGGGYMSLFPEECHGL